jgi:tetratricopeptide (TPR) repeat protein
LYGLAAVAAVLAIYFVNVPGMKSNVSLIGALSTNNPDTQADYLKKAIAAGPLGRSEAVEQFVQGSLNVRRAQLPEEYKTRYAQAAADAIIAEDAAHPDNVRTLTFLGSFLVSWGRAEEGVAAFERARELAPRRQINLIQLAAAYHAVERHDDALVVAREAYELQTENVAARLNYAAALVYVGIYTEADALLEGIDPATTVDYVAIMLPAYEYGKQHARIAALLEPIAKAEPSNVAVNIRLAATYLTLAKRAAAITTLESLRAAIADPGATKEIDALIASIKAGKNPLINLE